MTARVRLLGSHALQLHVGESVSVSALAQLARTIRSDGASMDLPGVEDVVPAEHSLLVTFRPAYPPLAPQRRALRCALAQLDLRHQAAAATHHVPICYAADFAPDLPVIARAAGISPEAVIALHAGRTYTVQAVGFAPGFAYLGSVDASIATPRLATPRKHVPAGAVGIADARTAVYPAASPGGWNIIGRSPSQLFDATLQPPCVLQVGDRVKFQAISRDEFAQLDAPR